MKKVWIVLSLMSIIILTACQVNELENGFARVEFMYTGDSLIESVLIEPNQLLEEPVEPTFGDYEFMGWYKDSQFITPWDFDNDFVTGHMKLYAKFVINLVHTVSKQSGLNDLNEPVYQRVTQTDSFRVNPKVVVTFALEIADIFKVLGLEQAGITYFGLPKSNLPLSLEMYQSNNYPNTGTLFEPNYDTLDLMDPDLIIIGGRSSSLYETLKQRYPHADILDTSNSTFSFTVQQQVFDNISLIFTGIKDDLLSYRNQFMTDLNTLKSKLNGEDALFLLVNGDNISVFGSGSRYGVIYDEVGFIPSDPDQSTLEAHGNVVSFEYISSVNPSIIFLMDRGQAVGSSGTIDLVMNNQLVKNTNAGKNGDIFVLDAASWYILPGGIESTIQMFEDLNQVFESNT